jgi:hypothetical protein
MSEGSRWNNNENVLVVKLPSLIFNLSLSLLHFNHCWFIVEEELFWKDSAKK